MNTIKKRIYFLFLIILSLISFSKSVDCSGSVCQRDGNQCTSRVGDSCSSNCKPNIFSSMCYDCGNKNYYEINEKDKTCAAQTSCSSFIIEGSNQCVSNCGNYYKLGSYCYPYCSGAMQVKDEVDRECKCSSYQYTTVSGGKTKYICLSSGCESGHKSYNIITKMCSASDCSTPRRKKEDIGGLTSINRCSTYCLKGEYVNKDGSYNYCVSECPSDKKYYLNDDGENVCSDDCKEKGLYYKQGESQCLNKIECNYISSSSNDRECKDSCLHNYGTNICRNSCPSTYPYKDEEICYKNCPSKFVKNEGDKKTCEKETEIGNCYFTNANEYDFNKICYKNGCPDGYSQIYNTRRCIRTLNCKTDTFYKYSFIIFDKRICYSSCDSIPFIGKNYYVDSNYRCICYLYGIKTDGSYKCYDSEKASSQDGFKFKQGNLCLYECQNGKFRYIINKNEGERYLDECYESYTECKAKKYPYYNHETYECFSNLPQDENYYPNEYDSSTKLPKEDSAHNTYYKDKCGLYFNFLTVSKVCKTQCDTNEYFISESNYKRCTTQCNEGDKIYINTYNNNECVTLDLCDYYYEDEVDGKKYCIDKCKNRGKFSFMQINSDKKCYDSCTQVISGENKYYFYNSDYECLNACPTNDENQKYAYDIKDGPQKCTSKPEDKYYNENFIIQDEPCTLFDLYDDQKCIRSCSTKVSNDKCVLSCPDSEMFYVNIQITIYGENVYINKCLSKCTDQDSSYNTIEEFTHQCLKNCNGANNIAYDGKCYPKCPEGYKYDPSSLSCKSSCPSGKYEKIADSILICKSECEGTKKYIKVPGSPGGDKECVAACEENQVVKITDHSCISECGSGEYKIKALNRPDGVTHDIYECVKFCPTENNYFYVKEDNGNYQKVCLEACPNPYNKMVENKYECIKNCPNEYPYYYESDKNAAGNYYKCTDHFKCNEGQFFCGGCKTIAQIKSQSKNYIENNKCVTGCSSGYKYYKYQKDSDFIYICKKDCDPDEYINGNECVKSCPQAPSYIGLNNICRGSCDSINGDPIYFYFIGTDAGHDIFMCTDKCPEEYPYYTDEKKCVDACPTGKYFSKQDNYCYNSCSQSPVNKYKLDVLDNSGNIIERKCISECDDPDNYQYKYLDSNECRKTCINSNHYVKEDSNECTSSCGTGYYIYKEDSAPSNTQKNFCVKQCHLPKLFIRGSECISACSSTEFYIREFKQGEIFLHKECLKYCPENYPFYYKTAEGKKECVENCNSGDYYFEKNNDIDNTKKDKLCLTECQKTSSDYKYKIESETSRRCYDICPDEKPFYKLNDDDNNCYEECPPDAPFHEKSGANRFICKTLENCQYDYVDFDQKLCLNNGEQCPPSSKKTTKYKFNSGTKFKYICSNECLPIYGQYSTYYVTCVNDCENDDLVQDKNLVKDPYNPQCICENLFYIDDGVIKCIPNSLNKECRDMSSYKINLYATKRCLSNCNDIGGILSPTEDICHPRPYGCEDYKNTEIKGNKCECTDKYYIDSNENKLCLKNGDVCPTGYQQKYVPSIKKCVKDGDSCPTSYEYLFINKYCLSSCPNGFSGKTCNNCPKYWEMDNNGNVQCLTSCNGVYIPSEQNKCVNKCEGQYSYYYDGECYSSCNKDLVPEIRILDAIDVINPDSVSKYKCECTKDYFWYIDNANKKHCIPDCFSIPGRQPFKFLVKETSQCVDVCPNTNKYFFNEECFTNCENEARSKYHLYLKTDTTNPTNNECQCEYLWHYKDSGKTKKECINENLCILSNTPKKFLSLSQNECVSSCSDNGEKGFNYVCYEDCPTNTTLNTFEDKVFDCFCNLDLGYWFEYEQYNGIYYSCALEECPLFHKNEDEKTYVRMNLIEKEKKCVKSCRKDGSPSNENFFALRAICIKSCPDLTYTNEENDECLFFDLNDTRIDTLDKFKRAANVQAKELYEKSQNLGGFLYNKFNTSLEIYAVDLKNSLKNISFKSNLTYIDFDTCIKKIFEYNSDYLTKDLTILVAKYDLLPDSNVNIGKEGSNSDKYLINPVEYELFSSNMNEKLDASVCSPNELIISYPLLLNKFDNYEGDINKNELRKKFDMGKELNYKDNGIDTFNYKDPIYNSFCIGLEINGKDLLYEDRYQYLYPNGKILCESNCTLNNTDFELERINCLCSYKNVFDFNRIEKETNDILKDPNFIKPTQSQLNVEAIKCLFNFTFKQATYNNGAFYYCSVSLLVQISMVIVCATYGIKAALTNVRHLLNRVNYNDNKIGRRIQFKGDNFNNDRRMSTNRPLNHPPKKNNVKEKYNEDIDLDSNIENDEINNTVLDNDLDSNNNEEGNYEINLKKGNKANNKNPLLDSKDSNGKMKAEYIPPDYSFKFFKPDDIGVIKKIDRSKIPFEINPDTMYLLERKKGIEYPENYLNGPFFKEQNIVVITDEKNKDANKIVNYIKNEKFKKDHNIKNDKNDDKENNKEEIKADYNIKKRNNLFGDNNSLSEKGEKNLIAIKKINKNELEYSEESLLKEFDEKDELKLKVGELGLLSSIKREQVFLRVDYEKYLGNEHSDIFCVYLAEILDKVYFAKICLFLKKIDIFPIHFSLYMFCHLLLLSLLTGIFSIKLIRKIWEEENFPDFKFYILYGLIFNIIIWIIYQIFLCLLDNRDKVKALIITKNELIEAEKNGKERMNEINYNIFREKFNSYKSQVLWKIIVFYIIVFLLSLFLTIYLISFFALYTGTKRRVLKAYYISIIEILLIKFVYGFALCSLRLASKVNKIRCLYNIVCFLNKYVS